LIIRHNICHRGLEQVGFCHVNSHSR
jgi:hypothetical protein